MKKSVFIFLAVLLAVLLAATVIFVAENETQNVIIGKLFHRAAEAQADAGIAATYGEFSIDAGTVVYYHRIEAVKRDQNTVRSDKEIIRDIVSNIVLMEEAERLGLRASEEEITDNWNSRRTCMQKTSLPKIR